MQKIDFNFVSSMTVVQLKAFLTSPELAPYRGDEKVTSKTTKPVLLEYIALAEGRYYKALEQNTTVTERETTEERSMVEAGQIIDGAKAELDPLPMTAHRRSKQRTFVRAYGGSVITSHLPNSERVQKYARSNGTRMVVTDKSSVAKLTSKQMRRVRKNANKHAEDFKYTDTMSLLRGHSLLARTPEGMGIFYQFSN
jgi:hypothetical protein